MARSDTATPLPDSSRWMAAASDLLPSPGAPVTAGTKAATCSSRPMLPVAALLDDLRAADLLALAGARGVRTTDSVAPTPAGCPVRRAGRDGATCAPCVGSQATKLLAALPATDCATAGVIAAHGSLDAWPETTSSPVMRLTRLPVCVRDVPDVGHLGAALVLGGDDVAAQRVVDALVLGGRHAHALPLHGPGEFVLDLFGDAVGRADDRRNRHLGERPVAPQPAWPRQEVRSTCVLLLEPNKEPNEPPVSQPARPSPAHAIRTASATLGCWRRAAAASMVVTVTSPLLQKSPLTRLPTYIPCGG